MVDFTSLMFLAARCGLLLALRHRFSLSGLYCYGPIDKGQPIPRRKLEPVLSAVLCMPTIVFWHDVCPAVVIVMLFLNIVYNFDVTILNMLS